MNSIKTRKTKIPANIRNINLIRWKTLLQKFSLTCKSINARGKWNINWNSKHLSSKEAQPSARWFQPVLFQFRKGLIL